MVDQRLAHCFNMYDVVRIDHFRGFDEYYAIPYGDKDAKRGWWEKGPGIGSFSVPFPIGWDTRILLLRTLVHD